MNDWQSAKLSLIPVLRRTTGEHDVDTFVHRSAGEDLVIWVARRTKAQAAEAYFFEYVTAENLADWHVGTEEVFEAAYENFSALDHGGQRIPDDSGNLVILDRFGASSAAAVGCSGYMKCFRELGDRLVVGVPSRDRLFITVPQSRMAQKVPEAVRRFYAKDENPISDLVYLWTDSGLTVLE